MAKAGSYLWMACATCLMVAHPGMILATPDDTRLHIHLDRHDMVDAANLKAQAKQAWPILLDRVVTLASRSQVPATIRPFPLLLKAQTVTDGSVLIFHGGRLWQRLHAAHIAYLAKAPAFYLRLQLTNPSGLAMPQSTQELMQFAWEQQQPLGILLHDQPHATAPLLDIRMQWITPNTLHVYVQGQSQLAEFSKTINVSGDPVSGAEQLLRDILLQARDAYATTAEEISTESLPAVPDEAIAITRLRLEIQRRSSLSEQLLLETSLRADPHVAGLQPSVLNGDRQVYQLTLKHADQQWIIDWFAHRGMATEHAATGWIIRPIRAD